MEPNNVPQPNNIPPPPPDYFASPALPPAPEVPQPKSKAKLAIIIVVVVLMLLIGVVAFVQLSKGQNANSPTSPANAPSATQEFLAKVGNKDFGDAFKMIQQNGTPSPKESVETIGNMNYLSKNYPVNECVASADSTATQVIYTCKNSSNKEVTVQFSLDSASHITAFKLTKEQSQQ